MLTDMAAHLACSSACLLAPGSQVDQKKAALLLERPEKKKVHAVWQCLDLFTEMCCCACQSLDPPLILAHFFSLIEQ